MKHYSNRIPNLTNKVRKNSDFHYIARWVNFAVASEGASKLKEIDYVHAKGMSAGELKQETLVLIEDGTPVITICPTDYTFKDSMVNIMEAKARGAYIIGVSNGVSGMFDDTIKICSCEEKLYPVMAKVPLQLLASNSAIERGLDPDKPRNLAKSITVK